MFCSTAREILIFPKKFFIPSYSSPPSGKKVYAVLELRNLVFLRQYTKNLKHLWESL